MKEEARMQARLKEADIDRKYEYESYDDDEKKESERKESTREESEKEENERRESERKENDEVKSKIVHVSNICHDFNSEKLLIYMTEHHHEMIETKLQSRLNDTAVEIDECMLASLTS